MVLGRESPIDGAPEAVGNKPREIRENNEVWSHAYYQRPEATNKTAGRHRS